MNGESGMNERADVASFIFQKLLTLCLKMANDWRVHEMCKRYYKSFPTQDDIKRIHKCDLMQNLCCRKLWSFLLATSFQLKINISVRMKINSDKNDYLQIFLRNHNQTLPIVDLVSACVRCRLLFSSSCCDITHVCVHSMDEAYWFCKMLCSRSSAQA